MTPSYQFELPVHSNRIKELFNDVRSVPYFTCPAKGFEFEIVRQLDGVIWDPLKGESGTCLEKLFAKVCETLLLLVDC